MATCMSFTVAFPNSDECQYTGGCLVKSYYYTHIQPGKSVRLPPDPQTTIYDWLFLKKVAKRNREPRFVIKTERPDNYESSKPRHEWSDTEVDYDSDDSASDANLLKALQRKTEWGIHLKGLRTSIESFRIGVKNRVMEMKKRPKKRQKIDKKKGIALQRVFNRNCCGEILKLVPETSDEISANQEPDC